MGGSSDGQCGGQDGLDTKPRCVFLWAVKQSEALRLPNGLVSGLAPPVPPATARAPAEPCDLASCG